MMALTKDVYNLDPAYQNGKAFFIIRPPNQQEEEVVRHSSILLTPFFNPQRISVAPEFFKPP